MNDHQSVRSAIETLFSDQRLAVLSTCGVDGHPYASLVCVVAEADLSGIHFATTRATRKYANLSAEPRAALLRLAVKSYYFVNRFQKVMEYHVG